MEDRLQRLTRLTSALQTRKRAYELRMARINNHMNQISLEREQMLAASNRAEIFPGSNLHYVKRLEALDKQIQNQRNELSQLHLLHMKAGADLRRSEIITGRERESASRLKEARYLEQVIDTTLMRRPG